MNKFKIGAIIVVCSLIVILYEVSINAITKSHKQYELSLIAELFQAQFEKRVTTGISESENLAKLYSYVSPTGEDFDLHCRSVVEQKFDFMHLQYADARFDSVIAYTNSKYRDITSFPIDYSGSAMRRAVELENTILQGPFRIGSNLLGVSFWSPIFRERKFLGVVTGVVALNDLFGDIIEKPEYANIAFWIIDAADTVIFSTSDLFDTENMETVSLRVGDRSWYASLTWSFGDRTAESTGRSYFLSILCVLALLYIIITFSLYNENKRVLEKEKKREKKLSVLSHQYENEQRRNTATEEELRKSEERYKALFDYNPIQTVVVDNNCRIIMYNFAKNRVVGRKPLIGGLMYKDYAEQHEIDMFSELVSCIEKREQKEFPELKYKDKYLHIHISPYSEGAIITSIDVTATKKIFVQLQQSHKMEAIGMLAGGIAHEFNNILGIILGNVEFALDEHEDENVSKECLEEIRKASIRAKDVVRQLLSFSSQRNKEKNPIRLGPLLEDAVQNLIRPSIPSSIEIYSSIEKNTPMVLADSYQIQQILINLCNNSAESIADGKGKIEIVLQEIILHYERDPLYKRIRPGNYVQLTVKDTGCGIEKRIQKKIFDPYFTTQKVGQGTGLGLAIVHGIISDHGGEIVYSTSDSGTSMHVLFTPVVGHSPII